MSSAASRKRQRKQRRAREKLWAARKALAERATDLEAYDRVIADMTANAVLSPFSGVQALAIVRVCREGVALDRQRLATVVGDLAKGVQASDPWETMRP